MAKKLTILAVLLLSVLAAKAQTSAATDTDSLPRPVTGTYSIETGGARALATYLSPLRYSGKNYALTGEWQKAFQKRPDRWIMSFTGAVEWRSLLNPAKTASMLGFEASFGWGMSYRHTFPSGLQIAGGPSLAVDGGLLYLPRNGNNPVAANASVGINLNASASYRFKIGRLPVLVSDKVSVPTLSAFFSPEYGETYYEIYLGNHKGLAHCGWWGNRFGISNLLSFDLDFGRTAMRIGYRYSLASSFVCNLNNRMSVHSFVIGVIPGGLGMKSHKKAVYAY